MKTRHIYLIHPWNSSSDPDTSSQFVATQKRAFTSAEQRARRERKYACNRRYYWRNRDAILARNRDYERREKCRMRAHEAYRRLKDADPLAYEVRLRDMRDYYATHKQQFHEYYLARNPEKHATARERNRAKRAEQPGYISRKDRSQRREALTGWIVMLRADDLSWNQIAKRTRLHASSCRKLYEAAMRQRGQVEANREKRRTKQQERDSFLLSSYRKGMSWAEYAKITGFNSYRSAWMAYRRALDRATRPDSQQAS